MKKTLTLFSVMLCFFLIGCDKSIGYDMSVQRNVEILLSSTGVDVPGALASHPAITNFQEYQLSGYDFDLDESFFHCYVLYQYSFLSANLGRNMFVLDDFEVVGGTLFINLTKNPEIQTTLPAFGTYTTVFSIGRNLYDSADAIVVSLP